MPELKIEGSGPSFFAELFGEDIGPGKQHREISKNSIEAILEYLRSPRRDEGYKGRIEVYADPLTLAETGAKKLAIADDGIGMTEAQMRDLHQIFKSGKTQSLDANYGIGARAATLRFNPHGVEFRSWRDGEGFVVTLGKVHERDGIPIYGTIDVEETDEAGNVLAVRSVIPIDEDHFSTEEIALMKPDFIGDHGTVVVLHGFSEADDTTIMPEDLRDEIGADGRARENTSYWLNHIFNRQYFEIPDEIGFRVRIEPDGKGGLTVRRIRGTKEFLMRFGAMSGTVRITGADVHWWVLGEGDDPVEPTVINRETGRPMTNAEKRKRRRYHFPWLTGTKNHAIVSAIHQGEQFDLATKVDAAHMLQRFGIFAGQENVCLVVEPDPTLDVRSNMNRTSLRMNKRHLPWHAWADEFAQVYPDQAPELDQYIRSKLGSTDFDTELDKIIAEMKDDFSVPQMVVGTKRKKSTSGMNGSEGGGAGRNSPDPDAPRKPRKTPDPNREIKRRSSPQTRRTTRVVTNGTMRGKMQRQPEKRPAIKLLTEEEHNFAFRGRAAEYARVATPQYPSGIIYVNRDFDVMEHLIAETLSNTFSSEEVQEQAEPKVREIVELVCAAQILFTVMTYRASFMVGHGKLWTEDDAEKLVSPEALTAIVLARPGMREQIKRRVNSDQRLRRLMMRQERDEQLAESA
ncbi:MAG: hypothetical protein JO036_01160 [Candidatus Eremiobacteraeota bacterium]|nr:hypothetical protein [Candidatus Eremiobacteraeota bacterium]